VPSRKLSDIWLDFGAVDGNSLEHFDFDNFQYVQAETTPFTFDPNFEMQPARQQVDNVDVGSSSRSYQRSHLTPTDKTNSVTTSTAYAPHYPLTAAPLPSFGLSGQRQEIIKVQESLSRQASQQVLQQKQPAVPWHYLRRSPSLQMQKQLVPQQQAAMRQQNSQQLASLPTMNAGPSLAPPEILPYALADYQPQLMLLEQENRRRLLIARQEQDQSQPTTESARTAESEQSAKQYPLATPTSGQIQAYGATSNADAKSPYENWMEVRSLSSGDNGWADVGSSHGHRNTYGYSDSSAIMFDPAKPLHVRTSANDEAMDGRSKLYKYASRGSVKPQKRKFRLKRFSHGGRRSMTVPSTQKPQSTGFVSDDEGEGDEEAGHRVRTRKRRRIQEADDDITEAEGDLELVNEIVADTLMGHGKEREPVEAESALDLADRDIVDVLLEQWTVSVY
jgi:hypothetical protein